MKITIGVPATKDRFYPRTKEIERIYRSLDDGNNIYLSAPRRVGKTSIMKHLQDNPKEGYTFIYGDFESCTSIPEFFVQLMKSIDESPAKQKWGSKIVGRLKDLTKRFESVNIEVYGIKVEAKLESRINWIAEVTTFLKELQLKQGHLVVMIDEFPQVILNLIQHADEAEAALFLHMHRQLRQQLEALQELSFIYTGSISLNHVVSQAADLKTVNDFDFIAVDPLERAQGIELATQIVKTHQLPLSTTQIAGLIDRIEWLVPFHIQLILKEVRGIGHTTSSSDPAAVIERAFENLLHLQNKPHFDHYFSRLSKAFKDKERKFVARALVLTANGTAPTYAILVNEANQAGCPERCAEILETLEIDGYLVKHRGNATYHFRSPILKAWWNRHESQKHQ